MRTLPGHDVAHLQLRRRREDPALCRAYRKAEFHAITAPAELGESVDQLFRQTVAEIVVFRAATEIRKRAARPRSVRRRSNLRVSFR